MHRTLRLSLLLLLGLGLASCSFGQQVQPNLAADSIRMADAEWRIDTLDGFLLKRYHFGEGQLFCAAQYLCVIELPPSSPRKLAFAYKPDRASVADFAEETGALAAINGSYFDMTLGNPICYLRIDGQPLGENTPQAADTLNRKYYQYAVLTLDSIGHPTLLVPDSNRHCEEHWPMPNIMTAGPMLLREGQRVPQRDDRTFVTHRHNRTALGLKPDGTVVILVADGRFKHIAEGFSLTELEHVMQWLGCTEAINLDGGGSTTMYVRDRGGVVNYPTDNNTHDHLGQRPVSNAILIL